MKDLGYARPNNEAPALPRRIDDDDPTASPVFLIQRRRFLSDPEARIWWDSDSECYRDTDDDGEPIECRCEGACACEDAGRLSPEEIVKRGEGHWEWDTVLVAFTREEADAYCTRRSYDGPFRSYSVPAIGALATLVDAQTDRI